MKLYLAGPYSGRETLKSYATELTRIGFSVTSSWLDGNHEINEGSTGPAKEFTDTDAAAWAASDLADVRKADVLVAFTPARAGATDGGKSGGRHVETGYALALNKPVLLVGQPENIFHRYGAMVTVVPDWHDAVIELASRLVSSRRGYASGVPA